jgi:predicted MFS family arabinose efflux permease
MNPWHVVVALGITQIISWGTVYYAFSLLIQPLVDATSASKAVVAGSFSAALVVAGLTSPKVGRMIDAVGGRRLMTSGSIVAAGLLATLAFVQHPVHLYLVMAGLGWVMATTLYDPAFAVLTQLFKARQKDAITVLTLFGGFASTVFWPLTQTLIERFGWQQALWILAALHLMICAPLHAWMLPKDTGMPSSSIEPGNRAALQTSMKTPTFYLLCAAFTGNALVFSSLTVHLISLLAGKGLTVVEAAWVGALIGPMQVLGRALEWRFMKAIPASRVGTMAMWMLPSALGLLALTAGPWAGILSFAFLYGISNGVMTIVRGAIPAELYGHENYGAVNGAMATPVLIAKAAGPVIAAWTVTQNGLGDNGLLWELAALSMASAVCFGLALASRPPMAARTSTATR